MKYFIDTEFIEGFHKPLFGRRRHFIDLISIGIVAEDGRTYYAISNEFNPKDASPWVRENIIDKLPAKVTLRVVDDSITGGFGSIIERNTAYKSNKQIADEIIDFINPLWLGEPIELNRITDFNDTLQDFILQHNAKNLGFEGICHYWFAQPEFYGYYADYDWVLFCSLFGTMMKLPVGFPMYCRDLKQMLDRKAANLSIVPDANGKQITLISFDEKLKYLKEHPGYPKQTNEHNALADAQWNVALWNFLQLY